jgi:hypothetical protein
LKTQLEFLNKKFGPDRCYRVDECVEIEAEDYVQAECGIETGGIIAVGLIKPDTEIGDTDEEKISFLESEVSWSNGVGASPQEMFVIKSTRGSKAEDSYTEEDGYGLNATEVTGADEEWLFRSLQVQDNRNFVKAINKRRTWGVLFVTSKKVGDGYLSHYRENVNVKGSLLIDESTKTRQVWSWRARASHDTTPPLQLIAPESIFVAQ